MSVSKEPARIAGMFDAIAGRYDFLNHFLSAGLDRRWRRRAIRALDLRGTERLLDVCTGTADLAIAAVSSTTAARDAVGVDFSAEMLRLGLEKVKRGGLGARVHLARGDATHLPLPDASVDAVTIAFGIRNVVEPARACAECLRVLRPGGRLAILEFGMPTTPAFRGAYRWYFRAVLPRIGRLVSKHSDAYSYLPSSVSEFPSGAAFAAMLQGAGFRSIQHVPLTLGVVYLYTARK